MEYKTTYTKQEIDELTQWFDSHTFEKELDMGKGMYIEDVNFTIKPMLHIAQTQYENKTFSGQIHQLYRIKELLIQQNKVTGEK